MSYLFIYAKDPTFDVWVMIMRYVIDSKNWAVLDGTTTVRPKRRIVLHNYKILLHFLALI